MGRRKKKTFAEKRKKCLKTVKKKSKVWYNVRGRKFPAENKKRTADSSEIAAVFIYQYGGDL